MAEEKKISREAAAEFLTEIAGHLAVICELAKKYEIDEIISMAARSDGYANAMVYDYGLDLTKFADGDEFIIRYEDRVPKVEENPETKSVEVIEK